MSENNNKLDLTKILKNCPKGWKFYSKIHGDVNFYGFNLSDNNYPIIVSTFDNFLHRFTKNGKKFYLYEGECILVPSREQQDWSKFEAPWYKKEIESKFHVGQYVTNGHTCGQITSIEDNYHCYKILDFMGGVTTIPFKLQDDYHLWTINDAKDGDVLALSWLEDKNLWEKIIIFKKYHSEGVEGYGKTFKNGKKTFIDEEVPYHSKTWTCNLHPATKEQRDRLFQKIKEAGYKWNDETNTLENLVKPKFKVGDRVRHKETNKHDVYEISKVYDNSYGITGFNWMIYMKYQDQYELVLNKFDPNTLKPFDKVLVKDDDTCNWRADFYSNKGKSKKFPYMCVGATCKYCIPYNNNTKHLVGTTAEAPEYYRYWED